MWLNTFEFNIWYLYCSWLNFSTTLSISWPIDLSFTPRLVIGQSLERKYIQGLSYYALYASLICLLSVSVPSHQRHFSIIAGYKTNELSNDCTSKMTLPPKLGIGLCFHMIPYALKPSLYRMKIYNEISACFSSPFFQSKIYTFIFP